MGPGAEIASLRKVRRERIAPNRVIAITPYGVGMVTTISKEGVSFKSTEIQGTPAEFLIDIYDIKGTCVVENMVVKPLWKKRIKQMWLKSPFLVELGGCFKSQTSSQKDQIDTYLRELVESEKREPPQNGEK